jgi:hypothetical protein
MENLLKSPGCAQYNRVVKSSLHLRIVSPVLLGALLASIAAGSLAADNRPDQRVAVIRGSDTSQPAHDGSVIVMRPERGSFMRVTARLAEEAQARDEREAAAQARATSRQISQAFWALEQAAAAAWYRPTGYATWVIPGKSSPPRPAHGRRHPVAPAKPAS